MAVPKKRLSKSKGRTRIAIWKGKAKKTAANALARAKSALNRRSTLVVDEEKRKIEEAEKLKLENQKKVEDKLQSEKDLNKVKAKTLTDITDTNIEADEEAE